MIFEFEVRYENGERETGTTFAETVNEAVENIIDPSELDEIISVNFSYTVRHSAYFDREDLIKICNF